MNNLGLARQMRAEPNFILDELAFSRGSCGGGGGKVGREHRRRIKIEEKAKVVASSVWRGRMYVIPCRASCSA